MQAQGIIMVVVLLLAGVANADVMVGTAAASVSGDGSVFLDMKGIGLYQVFVNPLFSPHGRHEYTDSINILTFDSGKTAPRSIASNAYIQNNVDAPSSGIYHGVEDYWEYRHQEDWGAMVLGGNTISTASANIDPETEEILSWNESYAVDSYVNVNVAALQASGFSLWLQYQIWGSEPVFTPITVPEPATLALITLGGVGILSRRRRSRI